MRDAFSNALVTAARTDPRVVLLTGDHGYALFDDLRRECPDKYLNCGVAEQNMVGVAAGLAKAGFLPIVYGLSAFVPVRVLEQIKMDVCYEQLPVVFAGDGAGVVYSSLGTSHQSTEDVAALRAVPEMTILSPADAAEMTACMAVALAGDGPVYLRMGKADLGVVHSAPPVLVRGRPLLVKPGNGPLALMATGSMVGTAMSVSSRWPGTAVYSVPYLKPIDEVAVADICRRHRAVVTLEEHSVYGGLGGAVAEIAAAHAPTWVGRVGIDDRFSKYCGSYSYLTREHRIDADSVVAKIAAFLDRARLTATLAAA
ncbi:transketolase family protein [Fimbriiglobus ruber]|uniref:Transketolase, C-terminal section n=1 Tax=Fimbriiglobus ruber TaxID=1908690 RepID=A0A225DY70_9BACT|nr:transketolase C-terminal domain-containing protein [Fimbriiglobus ruber]OWK46311.1 Transketolase, C-terminal section [Fimbriiglobus ruber]